MSSKLFQFCQYLTAATRSQIGYTVCCCCILATIQYRKSLIQKPIFLFLFIIFLSRWRGRNHLSYLQAKLHYDSQLGFKLFQLCQYLTAAARSQIGYTVCCCCILAAIQPRKSLIIQKPIFYYFSLQMARSKPLELLTSQVTLRFSTRGSLGTSIDLRWCQHSVLSGQ